MSNPLTHFNEEGRARMVDVGGKNVTERVAVATGEVHLQPETLRLIKEGEIKKGDVLAVAQVAGIMGAKKTPDVIPMCHPLLLTNVDIGFREDLKPNPETGLCRIHIQATVKVTGQTGVEMEALTAVSVAALTIYDMCKAVDREMFFTNIGLLKKSGGKSGTFARDRVGTQTPAE
ncbi:molybdenum cofactor biosynthesis protein MoaC [Candidatus Nitromaritima sp. SCGC AAA799-A02]|nr:molybdenum cofactor biosynthesis protein MoaC [Candidatus Nitromaritima sp. SCGC AAA799-A02]KMP12115.1 molybdenum cofactor biosynthesis protein MoaC [Candidatus Nitromaritima sp. SCGC AAA799-C22]